MTETRFRYHGTGGSLFVLLLINGLLTVVTLGIYSFWAKNKVRVFHYENSEVAGERFAYHGTGGELLIGALKGFGIIVGLSFVASLLAFFGLGATPSLASQAVIAVAVYLGIGGLMILAINGTRRYRFSRSSWRTFRFSYHGKLAEFAGMMLRGLLLTVLTLGFYGPSFANQRRAFLTNNARFGSERFSYDGDSGELFRRYCMSLLLTIPTLGLTWIWYSAFKHRHFWSHTWFNDVRFQSTVTGGELLMLHVTNALLTAFTLGIGAPWAVVRTKEFYCANLAMQGVIDWATMHQRMDRTTATAEGLAEALDIDVGIGM